MTTNVFYKAAIFFLLLHAVTTAFAQNKTTVKASVDKNRIFIGERIQLTLEADIPENEPIRFFIIDTSSHFEMDKQKIDTTNTSEGTLLKQVIHITSFDSGHWVIPSLVLGENLATDTIPVDVSFSPMDSTQSYHDIKDIIDIKPAEEKKKWWLWYAIGGSALLLGLIVFLLLRKKKPAVSVAAPPVNPYDEALRQLEKLQKEKTDQKQFYSRLVDIFRLYVYRKKDIHSMQKTTDDLVVQLKSLSIDREQFEKLSQSLRLSDFVKFARYVPSADDDRSTFETIKNTIVAIEKIIEAPKL
ncbi:MAG TPA: hypothetical protein VFI06_18020 [Chitinophagaceae bacterium]|nr:hypothetical protein [Chitinophagaceae bacterium]